MIDERDLGAPAAPTAAAPTAAAPVPGTATAEGPVPSPPSPAASAASSAASAASSAASAASSAASAPELAFSQALRRPPRIVLGPGLWIFGALSWSYAILGQFVVSGLPEALAVLTLLVVVSATYALAMRDGLSAVPAERALRGRRWLWPGVTAFACWLATTLLFTLVGKNSAQNLDKPITLLFIALSAIAIVFGRRYTHPGRPPRSKAKLALSVAAWVFAAFATLLALAMD